MPAKKKTKKVAKKKKIVKKKKVTKKSACKSCAKKKIKSCVCNEMGTGGR